MTGYELNLKLRTSLQDLEAYLNKYPDRDFTIWNFLYDMNDLQEELAVGSIYTKLVSKYQHGMKIHELIDYTKRSQRIFSLAGGFVLNAYTDSFLIHKIKEIHTHIENNFTQALQLFCSEYDTEPQKETA